MSFIARQQASQANNTLQLLTTTVYTYPTTNPGPQKSGVPVPVPAIVGGVIAGILLALILTAGWVCWGKSIKRTAAKQQSEVVSLNCNIYDKDQVCLSSPSRKHFTKRDSTHFIMLRRRSLEYKHTNHSSLVLQERRSDSRATIIEKWMLKKSMIRAQKYHYRL